MQVIDWRIRVSDIEMSTTRRSVSADVIVVGDQGNLVEGAGVSRFWVYPLNKNNNTTLFFSGTTGADGTASFGIGDKARPGEYRINLENVSKDGFVFDHNGSIRIATITKTK